MPNALPESHKPTPNGMQSASPDAAVACGDAMMETALLEIIKIPSSSDQAGFPDSLAVVGESDPATTLVFDHLVVDVVLDAAHLPADVQLSEAEAEAEAIDSPPLRRGDERRIRLRTPLVYRHRRSVHALRRFRDILIAGIALVFVAPVLGIACLAIWLEDRGSVVFTQKRVGRFERLFTIYKLRTMRLALCGDGVSPTSGADRRITNVGRFLRKTSIDELPQLLNIIRGDMTLVGPRPEMPFIVNRYARWQHLRHLEMPGLTGLWQITCRSTVPLDRFEATAIDLDYIRQASPLADLSLIFRTVCAIVRAKGAF
jgi:lipopolysaccharide/colanic/teichoic acid biosynthesis glycosyltransferase